MKRFVYLDHAAATPLDPRVKAAMEPFLSDKFGNPSAIYAIGREAREALSEARQKVAKILNARPDEIIFTGSGTESDNLAIFGVARAHAARGRHIITSAIEHHAVLKPVKRLEKNGFKITILPVDKDGLVSVEKLSAVLTSETTLVSVMYANNEVGTIEPVEEIGQAIKKWKKENNRGPQEPPFFHSDACQAASYLDLDVKKLGVDLLTINGSKIYGPKGTGVLFIRGGVKIEPLIFGGSQEYRRRAGTENVAGIVGLAKALALAQEEKEDESRRLIVLRDKLIDGIMTRVPKAVLNGHSHKRLPNNVNVSILDIEGEATLLYLDERGVAAATGSACDSDSLDPSHVILALGRPYEYAHASVRFTLGRATTEKDIDYVLKVLPEIVKKLRAISPVRLKT